MGNCVAASARCNRLPIRLFYFAKKQDKLAYKELHAASAKLRPLPKIISLKLAWTYLY